jgi:hypothetical protein
MAQTEVVDYLEIGLVGQLSDASDNQVDSYINNGKQYELTEITQADAFDYDVTINGTLFQYTSAASGDTKSDIADGLEALINAGSEPVTAIASGDDLYLRADVAGTAFTLVVGTNLSNTTILSNAQDIAFGKFVCQSDQADNVARLPMQATDITGLAGLGVVLHSHDAEEDDVSPVGVAFGKTMSILRKGRCYVQVEDAVSKGGKVYVRFTASGSYVVGSFRSDTDSGKAAQLPNARYKTSATAGQLAEVELNLPSA